MPFSTLTPLAVKQFDSLRFAIFDTQQTLHIYNQHTACIERSFSHLYTLCDKTRGFLIEVCAPYVCIAERFALNAVVVNTDTGDIMPFVREDYHADVSSFSVGFIKQADHVLFMHQTKWNRLDITDLSTHQCFTDREVYCHQVGSNKGVKYEEKNYLDYFHSLLHISPQGKNFLSNGWMCGPADYIRCGSVATFLSDYELSTLGVDYSNGYNWDRPATFIDDDCFVIAVDDPSPDLLDEQEIAAWPPHQLRFYRLSDRNEEQWLPSYKQLTGDFFPKNNEGEISGTLYYDSQYQVLIAISSKGIFAIDLEGHLQAHCLPEDSQHWQYSPLYHQFYFMHAQQLEVIDYPQWLAIYHTP